VKTVHFPLFLFEIDENVLFFTVKTEIAKNWKYFSADFPLSYFHTKEERIR